MNEQFDEFPIDRPVILKRLYQLFNCLADRRVLDFRFFAGRFDAIVAELKESDHFRSSFKKRSSTTATAMASEAVATSQSAVPAHTSLRTRLSRQVSCHHFFGPNPVNFEMRRDASQTWIKYARIRSRSSWKALFLRLSMSRDPRLGTCQKQT